MCNPIFPSENLSLNILCTMRHIFNETQIHHSTKIHISCPLSHSDTIFEITPVAPLKPRFCHNIKTCLLFTPKYKQQQQQQQQQRIFFTCCYQYHIQNQRTRLPVKSLKASFYDHFETSGLIRPC